MNKFIIITKFGSYTIEAEDWDSAYYSIKDNTLNYLTGIILIREDE